MFLTYTWILYVNSCLRMWMMGCGLNLLSMKSSEYGQRIVAYAMSVLYFYLLRGILYYVVSSFIVLSLRYWVWVRLYIFY